MEACSREEMAQKEMKQLEKSVDLEFFGQVFSPVLKHLGVAASSSTTPQQSAQASTQAATTAKGKEMQQEEPLSNIE